MTINITNGDCLKLMKGLPDKSIDLFICDLPYGETNCKWDIVIDLDEFWKEFKRLRKSKRTACIHFCSTKFGYTLIKSNEKMFKMDMVWKKRNKTGGLQSRHRPMRNHEMVYFFYEQAPKYNRDKYHKRIQAKLPIIKDDKQIMGKGYDVGKQPPFNSSKYFEPPNPLSVIEEEKPKKKLRDKTNSTRAKEGKDIFGNNDTNVKPFNYDPPNPASVVEEKPKRKTIKDRKSMCEPTGIYPKENQTATSFDPPNPASIVEEKPLYKTSKFTEKVKKGYGYETGPGIQKNKKGDARFPLTFDPPNPASVVEASEDVWGNKKFSCGGDCGLLNEDGSYKGKYEPPNPSSVLLEEFIEPAEDEPYSMYESKKVFIGKRHHQTEKPLDILEFFIKYWSDEGHTILDPTMGSGSTGVACKTLKRNFIGYEMNEKIFKVAENRIKKVEVII